MVGSDDVDICFYAVYGIQVDIVFMPYFLFCQTQEVVIVFKSPNHFIILHLATTYPLSNTKRIVANIITISIGVSSCRKTCLKLN